MVQRIIRELDSIPTIEMKKQYLEEMAINPEISENKRIAVKIMIEDDFVERYYKLNIVEKLKNYLKIFFK